MLAATAKSLQSCLTLCDPTDDSPPGSPVAGILQASSLEWVAISFSNAWKWKVKVKSLSRVWLFTTPWTAAYQAPPSMEFSGQEYWSRVPLPSPSNALGEWIIQQWQVNRNPMQRDATEEEMAADPYVTREYFRFPPAKAKNTSLRNLYCESTRTVWKWLSGNGCC